MKALANTRTSAPIQQAIIAPPLKSFATKAPTAVNPQVTATRNMTRANSAFCVTFSCSTAAACCAAVALSYQVGLGVSSATRGVSYPSASGAIVRPASLSCSHTSSARS